eukprot:1146988-Pelagomonas_calceolata.AAC.2
MAQQQHHVRLGVINLWVIHNSAPTCKSASAPDSDTMAQQQHHVRLGVINLWVIHNPAPTCKSAPASDSDTLAQQQHHVRLGVTHRPASTCHGLCAKTAGAHNNRSSVHM